MQSYRTLPADVYMAETRLDLVVATLTREEDKTVAEVAAEHHRSVPQVYKLLDRVRRALVPGRPGPRVLAANDIGSDPADPKAEPPIPAPRLGILLPELVCTLAIRNVSIRGIRDVFVALGLPAPAPDTLVDFLRRGGRAARRLLARANDQVRLTLECLAGDDIFFHRTPIKVLLDPVSGALLDVLRWPWHAAEDWALFMEDWPALALWVSDLGTDLVGATTARKLAHQADFFHERAWWTEKVFEPLSRREARRAAVALTYWDGATRPQGPGRRTSAATVARADARRADAEADFFQAVRAEEQFIKLLQPLDPEGRRWTDARVHDQLAEIEREVKSLPRRFAKRVWSHVRRHRTRWCAHRILWDRIDVTLRAGTTWTREQVLDAVVALRWAEHRHQTAPNWPLARAAQQEATEVAEAVRSACANLDAVRTAVASLLERPRRSSSLVEALNSRLRVLQMVHRNVSDHLLALVALAWNLTPRRDGRRSGPSPYARLGIDFANDTRPWHDVLLEEMAAD